MSNDFVLNVKQIGQYPVTQFATPGTLMLIQAQMGGPYQTISVADAVATALEQSGESLFLTPGAAINWNGAAGINFDGTQFVFSPSPVVLQGALTAAGATVNGNLTATGTINGGAVQINGQNVPTFQQMDVQLQAIIDNSVTSFDGRTGNVVLDEDDIARAGGALINSPVFIGYPMAPTPIDPMTSSDLIATTQFVQNALCWFAGSGAVVQSFNGRGGAVVLTAADITAAATVPGQYATASTPPSGDVSKRIATTAFVDDAIYGMQQDLEAQFALVASELDQFYAPINSPALTGIPTAPTAAQTVNSGQIATTAFVHSAIVASTTGVASFNGRTGAVLLENQDLTDLNVAFLAGPQFTGIPEAPTAPPGTGTTQIATCAFVEQAVGALNTGVVSFNGRGGAVVLTQPDIVAVGAALLASPAFSGSPTGPTAAPGTATTQLATTQFVSTAIAAVPVSVSSFNGRTGAITFQANDLSAVGGALLAGPAFTGAPTAPTANAGTNTTQIATCAFVEQALTNVVAGVTSFNTRTGPVVLTGADVTGVGGAMLANPTFTGVPAAPTAVFGTNTAQLATTAFVQAALAAAPGGVSSFNSRTGAVTFQAADVSAVGGALLANPNFTGIPTAPTAAPGVNTTQLATCAFVAAAVGAMSGVTTWNGRAGAVTLSSTDIQNSFGAIYYQADSAPSGGPQTFWFDSLHGQLYVNYVDPVSSAQSWVIANTVAGAAAPQYFRSRASASDPPSTTSTAGVMCGFAVPFTPKSSGKMLFTVTAEGSNNANGFGIAQLWWGTGTPPANGAPSTGTSLWFCQFGGSGVSATVVFPFTITDYHEGFAVGTTYWADLLVQSNSSSNAVQIYNILFNIIELP